MNSTLFSIWAAASILLAADATCGDVDVLSYKIDVTLEESRLHGSSSLLARSESSAQRMELQLASAMTLRSCTLGDRDVPFEHSGWDLSLDLESAGSPRGEFELRFEFDGSPYNKQSNGLVRTVISEEHAYARHQYAWYPRKAEDLAVFEISLTTRGDWLVRSGGTLEGSEEVSAGKTWTYRVENPCLAVGFVAGPYVAVTGSDGLQALVFEGHEPGAKALLQVAAQAIELYTDMFGPIEEPGFALVEMPRAFGSGSGYGEVGYALIGEGAFANAAEASWAPGLIEHEVAHTWWGREVAFSNFANEMLATYSTLRCIEHARGEDAALAERTRLTSRVAKVASERPLVALPDIEGWSAADRTAYTVCAYDKAAMALHALERAMGRRAFDKALRKLFSKQRGQVVDYAIVRDALGGSKYKWVLAQWERAEVPRLRVEYQSAKAGKKFKVEGTVTQEDVAEPYRIDLTLRALRGSEAHDFDVELKGSRTTFKFTCPFEPDEIVIDPDRHIVRAFEGLGDPEALRKAIFAVANNPGEADPAQLGKTVSNIRRLIAAGQTGQASLHTALGRCAFRLGDFELARVEFAVALEGGAGGPFHRAWIHLRLGCIADLEGDRKAAEACYEKVLGFADQESHAYQRKLAARFAESAYRGHQQDG